MEVSLTTSLLYGCFLIVAYHTWVRFLIRNSGRHNNGIGAFVKALSLVERSWLINLINISILVDVWLIYRVLIKLKGSKLGLRAILFFYK